MREDALSLSSDNSAFAKQVQHIRVRMCAGALLRRQPVPHRFWKLSHHFSSRFSQPFYVRSSFYLLPSSSN
jgi:hypothetical protein